MFCSKLKSSEDRESDKNSDILEMKIDKKFIFIDDKWRMCESSWKERLQAKFSASILGVAVVPFAIDFFIPDLFTGKKESR